jgi:XTP/dITP diphosphohydrolase
LTGRAGVGGPEASPAAEPAAGPDDRAAPDALADLIAVMDRLRSPGGCPWDAEQTHESLLTYAVEEVFEVAEAVETGDRAALLEELGDLLLQVVFHARVAQEHPTEPFGIGEVAAGIAAKLRHRHPHVFADVVVTGADDVHRRWERIKRAEKSRTSTFDGIPLGMPALARAQKVISKARRAGLPIEAAPAAGGATSSEELQDALGRQLLAIVRDAEEAGLDAEAALRGAVRELEAAARQMEPPPV